MDTKQMDLLLKQLFDCSLAIYKAIENNDSIELDKLIDIKESELQLIENNKKFFKDLDKFNNEIEKIKKQETINLELLNSKKNDIYKQYQNKIQNSKIMKKYEQSNVQNGSIVDIKE